MKKKTQGIPQMRVILDSPDNRLHPKEIRISLGQASHVLKFTVSLDRGDTGLVQTCYVRLADKDREAKVTVFRKQGKVRSPDDPGADKVTLVLRPEADAPAALFDALNGRFTVRRSPRGNLVDHTVWFIPDGLLEGEVFVPVLWTPEGFADGAIPAGSALYPFRTRSGAY
jgi:hypothetical protein